MEGQYGLYEIDPGDPLKRRIPRETVRVYGEIASVGAIPRHLASRYPVDFE